MVAGAALINPHYHCSSDLHTTLNMDFAARVCHAVAVAGAVAALAGAAMV